MENICTAITPFILNHATAIGLVAGYLLLTIFNQMPSPGTWKDSGGAYGWLYRVSHSLAATPIATAFEARVNAKLGVAPITAPSTTTTAAVVTTTETK